MQNKLIFVFNFFARDLSIVFGLRSHHGVEDTMNERDEDRIYLSLDDDAPTFP